MTHLKQVSADMKIVSSNDASSQAKGDLSDVFRTLWRKKTLVLLSALLFGVAGVVITKTFQVPYFTSSAEVALVNRQEQVADLESVLSGLSADQSTINTEVAVLRSLHLLGKLALDLELQNDPEFNTTLLPPSDWSPLVVLSRMTGIDFGVEPAYTDIQQLAITVQTLRDALKISNYRQSYVFVITATTTDPDKSALISNRLAELYINDQLDQKFEATEKATGWLTDRTTELKVELEKAESQIQAFTSSITLVSPEALDGQNRQLKDLRSRIEKENENLGVLETKLTRFEQAKALDTPSEIAAIVGDPAIDQAVKLFNAGSLSEQAFLAAVKRRETQLNADLLRQTSQLALLESSRAELSDNIAQQSEDLITLDQFSREAEASRLLYEHFLSRLKETRVQQGIQQADSRVLSAAVPPLEPSSPSLMLNLALSVALGLLLGAAIVLWREFRTNRVRSSAELEALTGLTVLSEVLKAPRLRRHGFIDFLTKNSTSGFAESTRNLRTSLMMASAKDRSQIYMITSSVPGEGKTTQALGLAANFASIGQRVLLIEADIRRRTMTAYFQNDEGLGLVSAVNKGSDPTSEIQTNDLLGIDVLLGQKSTENAADFFASEAFGAFLEEARKRYDTIIIDTPPVLAVTDARIIGRHADAILYVVRWDSTDRSQIKSGIRSLETANLQIDGLILTQVDPKGMRRYGYEGGMGYGGGYYA